MSTRIIHTHDTEAKWLELSAFIPKQGEIIIYDADENYAYERIKIGDGKTSISSLPFASNSAIEAYFNVKENIIYADGGRIK